MRMRLWPMIPAIVFICVGAGSLVGNLLATIRTPSAGTSMTSRERLEREKQRRAAAAAAAASAATTAVEPGTLAALRGTGLTRIEARLSSLERLAGGPGSVALGRSSGVQFSAIEYVLFPRTLRLTAAPHPTTVTAWVRLESSAAVINTVFATRFPGCNGRGAAHLGISLAVNSWQTADRQLVAEWGVLSAGGAGGGGASVGKSSCATLRSGPAHLVPRDRWVHVALVIAAQGSALYMGGELVAMQGAGMAAPLPSLPGVAEQPLPLVVGAHGGGSSAFGGRIARLNVWEGALTARNIAAEIGLLKAGGVPPRAGYQLGEARLQASLLTDPKAPGRDATGSHADGELHNFRSMSAAQPRVRVLDKRMID